MLDSSARRSTKRVDKRPHILVGVTSAQTCLILPDRLRALREAGFRVSLVCAPGEWLNQIAENDGIDCYPLPMVRRIAPFADCVTLLRFWLLLRRLRPDVVEFSTPKAGLLGSVAARLSGVPVRIYLLRGLRLETETGLMRILLLWVERTAARSAQIVVCNSRSLQESACKCGVAPDTKLLVLGEGSSNGVDTERFSPGTSSVRRQLGIPSAAPVVGFVGRLTRDKGLPELLEAFAMVLRKQADAYLLLVGWFDAAKDALDHRLRERIESHPRVIITGFVNDTVAYYRAMDVLVLPSWREGFPNVVLEAAASAVPAIVSNCTGSRDAVVTGVTGLLVPTGDPAAINSAVRTILGDADARKRMSQAARAWVAQNYQRHSVLGLTVAFYKSLVIFPTEESATSAAKRVTGVSASWYGLDRRSGRSLKSVRSEFGRFQNISGRNS